MLPHSRGFCKSLSYQFIMARCWLAPGQMELYRIAEDFHPLS